MDILRVTLDGANKPTQIMYKANLSWVALLGHLKALTASDFMKEVDFANRKEYEVTSRGIELLQNYQKVVSAVRDLPTEKLNF
jgi:predicted transcriptional regulator